MLRAKQIVSSMAALVVIGIVAAVAGLSVFSASGQTDDAETRTGSKRERPALKGDREPAPQTYVKTYYVGDLVIPPMPVSPPATAGVDDNSRRRVDMTPLVDLITSTVAKGTWTVHDAQGQELRSDGRPIELRAGAAPSGSKTVGQITPFFLSISLIIRHTKEGHDEVANLLRNLRRLLDSREHPGGVEGYDRDQEVRGITTPPNDQKPAVPAPTAAPDRKTRIQRLLDELRQEVEQLPKEPN